MILLKYLLLWGGIGIMIAGIGLLARDLYRLVPHKQSTSTDGNAPLAPAPPVHWRKGVGLTLLGWIPILLASGIVVVPSGMGGVRVSQTSGTLPGTLYPGAHFLTPLAESVVLFDTRDQLFTTGAVESSKVPEAKASPGEPLRVQAKEGLTVGLAITVRYPLE